MSMRCDIEAMQMPQNDSAVVWAAGFRPCGAPPSMYQAEFDRFASQMSVR